MTEIECSGAKKNQLLNASLIYSSRRGVFWMWQSLKKGFCPGNAPWHKIARKYHHSFLICSYYCETRLETKTRQLWPFWSNLMLSWGPSFHRRSKTSLEKINSHHCSQKQLPQWKKGHSLKFFRSKILFPSVPNWGCWIHISQSKRRKTRNV